MTDRERTAYSATQAFGLALVAAALVFMVTVALIFFGADEDIIFIVVVAAIAAAGAYLVNRFDSTWARIVGLVLTVLVFMGSFFFLFGVFQPFSPVEFVVGLAYVFGVILAVFGGIRALLAARKGRVGPTAGEARTRSVVFTIIGVAAVVSVAGFFATKETVSDAEAAGATRIEMTAFEFEPTSAAVPVGGSLLIANADPFVHDFTLSQLDIAVDVGPGSEALVDLSSVASGTYDYFCSLHSASASDPDGMRGSFTIGS
jgi:plastocyanin